MWAWVAHLQINMAHEPTQPKDRAVTKFYEEMSWQGDREPYQVHPALPHEHPHPLHGQMDL